MGHGQLKVFLQLDLVGCLWFVLQHGTEEVTSEEEEEEEMGEVIYLHT